MMVVYPDIELQKGRCVNLARGRTDVSTVYDVDPVEAACDFALQGAEWLQVVDLDAVFNAGDNAAIINEIIRKARAKTFRLAARSALWTECASGSTQARNVSLSRLRR